MVYVVPTDQLPNSVLKCSKRPTDQRNIHISLRFFLVLLQMVGMLPQNGLFQPSERLHFTWKSWKVLYALILLVLNALSVALCFSNWFYAKYTFKAFGTFLFFLGSLFCILLYMNLAYSWSKLMKSWCHMDKMMNAIYGYPKSLDKRLRLICGIFLTCATVDHLLSLWSRYEHLQMKYGDSYDYKRFVVDSFPAFYKFLPVNPFTAVISMIATVHATITWALNDLFIVLMSSALALRFQQVTEKISRSYKTEKNETFWLEIREDYDRLSKLCKQLDNHISYIVLLSYSINMFFLLVQLYYSLRSVSGVIGKIYFFYSFSMMILKVVAVSLYGAWINDGSLEPAGILNAVSSDVYNNEIRRLLLQISFDNVAITGFRMFKVTRGIILSIAGAIVTYELVLIQFNAATNSE